MNSFCLELHLNSEMSCEQKQLLNTKGASSFMIYLNGTVTYELLHIEMDRFLKSYSFRGVLSEYRLL